MAAVLSPPSSPAHQQSPHGITPFSSMAGSDHISKTQRFSTEDAASASLSSVDTISAFPSAFQPLHKSVLDYALVRDFAYDSTDVLHYGVVPQTHSMDDDDDDEDDQDSNEASKLGFSWEQLKSQFEKKPNDRKLDFVPLTLRDGPPYAIDPDLQSPVVKSIRRKKYFSGTGSGLSDDRANPDNSKANGKNKYIGGGGDDSNLLRPASNDPRRDSHFAGSKILRHSPETIDQDSYDASSDANDEEEDDEVNDDDSEYSRDYQFSITSPDEEMHGKAVALFDFARENENELPLVEGQVIWVSYRHGEGWLVAEDPKTRESGLVPEAYVRLLREIQGGWHSLNNLPGGSETASPLDPSNPQQFDLGSPQSAGGTQEPRQPAPIPPPPQQPPQRGQSIPMSKSSSQQSNGKASGTGSGGKSHAPPVVSTFSTSSKDLDPYPSHLLAGEKEGQTSPPKIEHYHGQGGGSGGEAATTENSGPAPVTTTDGQGKEGR